MLQESTCIVHMVSVFTLTLLQKIYEPENYDPFVGEGDC